MLIAMLQAPEDARRDEIVAATDYQAYTVRGAMLSALRKQLRLRLRLIVNSAKEDGQGSVYRITETRQ
jgi:hypothetical protein